MFLGVSGSDPVFFVASLLLKVHNALAINTGIHFISGSEFPKNHDEI